MVVSPLIVPTTLFVLVGLAEKLSMADLIRVGVVSAVIYCVLPLIYLFILIRKGHIQTIEARDHQSRKKPLLWGSLLLTAAIPGMVWAWPEPTHLPFLMSSLFAFNAVILALITTKIKISLHVCSIASMVSIMLALKWFNLIDWIPGAPLSWVIGVGLIALVSWARIDQTAHSNREVIWGLVYGMILPWLEIAVFRSAM